MEPAQKKNALFILLLGGIYFILFIFPNARNAADEHMLSILSQDENTQYPYVINMITPDETIKGTLINFVFYKHYYYGFPFYFLSALVLIPVRILLGEQTSGYTQLNLLLLRQFINVLPMTAAIIVLVYQQTGFRSRWRSVGLFLLLAFTPAVVRNNINWWHPDSLGVLFTVLTLFFLRRDGMRFGWNFFTAALFCGLATSTKIYGFFFFLAVAGYLLAGLVKHTLNYQRLLLVSLGFITVMAGTIVASNPELFFKPQRERFFEIQTEQNYYVTHGWGKPGEESEYRTGLTAWYPYLEKWYGQRYFLALVLLSLVAGNIWGDRLLLNRLTLGWVAAYGGYLLFAVAIKNDHYWLPVMLPVFSNALSLVRWGQSQSWSLSALNQSKTQLFHRLGIGLLLGLIMIQLILFLVTDVKLYNQSMITEFLLLHNIQP